MTEVYMRHLSATILDLGTEDDEALCAAFLRRYPGAKWVEVRWSEWGRFEPDRTSGGPDDWTPGWCERDGFEVDWYRLRYRDGSESILDDAEVSDLWPALAERARKAVADA